MTPHEQIETRLSGGETLAISGSTELELGARGVLLLLDRQFRLDVCPMGDTLKLISRGLAGARLRSKSGGYGGAVIATEEQLTRLRELRPCRFDLEIEILTGDGLRRADILVGALQIPDRGTTSLTAQALVTAIE